MNNLLFWEEYSLPLLVTLGLILVIVLIYVVFGKPKKAEYFVKDRLMTNTEITYYNIFQSYFGDKYIILPQINLATVIDKKGGGYRSELFRNADFGVFDYNYRPILLIEINDNTHFKKDRMERDKKVAEITKSAKLPLVTFWTKDGIDHKTIYKTLSKYL